MSDKDGSKKQKIEAGDGSHNVQVGRDYHHHEAPKPSGLIRPDQGDVEQFDPRYGRIREEADKVRKSAPMWMHDSLRTHFSGLYIAIILALAIAMAIMFLI